MTVWDAIPQSRATDALRRQVAAGESGHAWLLLGPSGSGKRPVSIAIAAALNCSDQPLVGCGVCSTCLRISRRRYPDVHHVVPEGPLIPVDVVRDVVLTEASRSPFEGRTKVFIIEEADRMNPAAQNALLKTLEEPHDDSVFILISDQEEELLETVRSRCRVARLEPVPESRIIELLKREGITDEVALLAARLSEGDLDRARAIAKDEAATERRGSWVAIPRRLVSPQDALDVATEVVAEARAAVKANEDAQKAEIVELAEAMGEGRGTAGARNALMKRHRRESRRVEEQVLVEALQSLGSFYRDVVAIRKGGVEAVANLDLIGELETWAGSPIGDSDLLSATQRCIDAAATLPLNANVPLAIEATMLEVARLAPAPARVGAT